MSKNIASNLFNKSQVEKDTSLNCNILGSNLASIGIRCSSQLYILLYCILLVILIGFISYLFSASLQIPVDFNNTFNLKKLLIVRQTFMQSLQV